MAYEFPTPADFKARFPEMATMDDAIIARVLADAGLFVDTTWAEPDYAPAIMYLAAHLLQWAQNYLSPDGGGGSVGVDTYLKSVAFADRRLTYDVVNKTASTATNGDAAFDSTYYGTMYLMLLRRNTAYVLVV